MDPEAGLAFISNDSKYLDTALKTKQTIRWADLEDCSQIWERPRSVMMTELI